MNHEKMWDDLKRTFNDMLKGDIPIGDAGEQSQLISILSFMEGIEKIEAKKDREAIRAEEREAVLTELAECYELLGNIYHVRHEAKRSEIFYGVMTLLKQQKFDPKIIQKEISDCKKQLGKMGYYPGGDNNEQIT